MDFNNEKFLTLKLTYNPNSIYLKELEDYDHNLLKFISKEIKSDNAIFGSCKFIIFKFRLLDFFEETKIKVSIFNPLNFDDRFFRTYIVNYKDSFSI